MQVKLLELFCLMIGFISWNKRFNELFYSRIVFNDPVNITFTTISISTGTSFFRGFPTGELFIGIGLTS